MRSRRSRCARRRSPRWRWSESVSTRRTHACIASPHCERHDPDTAAVLSACTVRNCAMYIAAPSVMYPACNAALVPCLLCCTCTLLVMLRLYPACNAALVPRPSAAVQWRRRRAVHCDMLAQLPGRGPATPGSTGGAQGPHAAWPDHLHRTSFAISSVLFFIKPLRPA